MHSNKKKLVEPLFFGQEAVETRVEPVIITTRKLGTWRLATRGRLLAGEATCGEVGGNKK